ncbi:MAG: PIG-L deacetylase family protein [Vicinamibacterales bacterium]
MTPRTLTVVTAHPDDESLGFGGAIARYAEAGADVTLVTATRGERGRWRGTPFGADGHPGADALGQLREAELRAAAGVLGVRRVDLLGYGDQGVDRVPPQSAIAAIAAHLRRERPSVVLTFGPDGAYGHPDHIAMSQLTSAAVVAAANPAFDTGDPDAGRPHAVAKLYFLAWPEEAWAAYQAAFTTLVSRVDGVERRAVPWPDWAITTTIDTSAVADRVWRAVQCHDSQISGYEALRRVSDRHRDAIWSRLSFYRAFSTVNGGRTTERDVFEGLPS